MRDRSSLDARINRRMRARHGEHKEDCTDGRFSIINPVTFKGDALIQVWVDSRELATISEWLDKTGYRTRFMSEVVKEGLHTLCEDLVSVGEVNMVEDTVTARRMLEDKYRVCLNPRAAGGRDSRRGEKNALHNIILSERKKEEGTDELRDLQRLTKENYAKMEREGTFKSKGSIFDELVALEKGGSINANTNEDENDKQ